MQRPHIPQHSSATPPWNTEPERATTSGDLVSHKVKNVQEALRSKVMKQSVWAYSASRQGFSSVLSDVSFTFQFDSCQGWILKKHECLGSSFHHKKKKWSNVIAHRVSIVVREVEKTSEASWICAREISQKIGGYLNKGFKKACSTSLGHPATSCERKQNKIYLKSKIQMKTL